MPILEKVKIELKLSNSLDISAYLMESMLPIVTDGNRSSLTPYPFKTSNAHWTVLHVNTLSTCFTYVCDDRLCASDFYEFHHV